MLDLQSPTSNIQYQISNSRFHSLRRQFDRVNDVLVASATAEISRDGLANLWFSWVGVFFQKWHQGHQKARCAEATLHAVGFPERFLQGMQVVWSSQSLDSEDLVSVSLHGEHQARADRLSIEQDRARSAHAVLAADVCAGQAKVVAQEIAQQQTRLDGPLVLRAVDGDGYSE